MACAVQLCLSRSQQYHHTWLLKLLPLQSNAHARKYLELTASEHCMRRLFIMPLKSLQVRKASNIRVNLGQTDAHWVARNDITCDAVHNLCVVRISRV